MADLVHVGRTIGEELGEPQQVAWCTGQGVEAPETTTRLINLVTCVGCIRVWNDSVPYYAQVSLVEDIEDVDRYSDTIADDISIEGAAAVAESLDEGMRGM